MSTRAIAPIVGASKSQIADDLAGVQNRTPDAEPRQIIGRDGKTYSAPSVSEPPKRKRQALRINSLKRL